MDRLVQDFGAMYRERNKALAEVVGAHHGALLRLALAAEYRDNDTGVHIVRLGFLAEALALSLGQSRSWSQMLRRAAPMHDIGKIGIPDAVLKKPGGLTPEERVLMNRHTVIGADILRCAGVPLFQLSAEVALTHHERFDGTGYPNGLAAGDIPLAGRIVSAVDYFDALTMDRCYRAAFPDEQVKKMMLSERGRAFDPDVIDAVMACWPRLLSLRDRINDLRLTFADLVDDRVAHTLEVST
ncbi:MAG: HD domain-containing phosphohydrolase [Rhizobacter sp.]